MACDAGLFKEAAFSLGEADVRQALAPTTSAMTRSVRLSKIHRNPKNAARAVDSVDTGGRQVGPSPAVNECLTDLTRVSEYWLLWLKLCSGQCTISIYDMLYTMF